MNRTQAMKEAARLFGKKRAAVRDNGKPTNPEGRAEGTARCKELRTKYQAAKAANVPAAEQKVLRAELDAAISSAMRYRYQVGYIGGVAGFAFFSVNGEGDTWEEAFAKVDDIYKKQAA